MRIGYIWYGAFLLRWKGCVSPFPKEEKREEIFKGYSHITYDDHRLKDHR